MKKVGSKHTEDSLAVRVDGVRKTIAACLDRTCVRPLTAELSEMLTGGKMLRSRLGFRIGNATEAPVAPLTRTLAAIELIHAASLLHDDVIDGAAMRRGAPSFWVRKGTSGAVLLGDLLVCQAMMLISENRDLEFLTEFISLTSQMCDGEVEQELLLRHNVSSWQKSVDIARRKTGALFAAVAYYCGGADPALREALREAGYKIGTAYQLSDDLLDAFGEQTEFDKTLGTDKLHAKPTAASTWRGSHVDPARYIHDLCTEAEALLSPWPGVQAAWHAYLAEDIGPAINKFVECFRAKVAS